MNMLLLSSSGPIKTPVGACATAVESVEIGVDTILRGKAKVMIVGGFDDFGEEGSYEFAQMQATSNSINEFAMGREPKEHSRPASSTRAGFMESQGAGIQVLMRGDLAVQMGVPIRGIVAHTSTATDREGRSVPAPGQGILSSAKESGPASRYSSLEYRREQLREELERLESWVRREMEQVGQEGVRELQEEAERRRKEAQQRWGHGALEGRSEMSPLRAGLATFGLTVDDIGVASFHGTGTKANDTNEARVLFDQMRHLGRSEGNSIAAIMQKHLTGHPKGAAAAWMLNGAVQCLLSGKIPGNRNLDNVDSELESVMPYIYFPSRPIQTDGIKACLLKSFGFGQVGGEVLVVHPNYVLASLSRSQYEQYALRRSQRQQKTYVHHHAAMAGQAPFVRIQQEAPYAAAHQNAVLLNPLARRREGAMDGQTAALRLSAEMAMNGITGHTRGVGVDVESLSSLPLDNEDFVQRNFTARERDACSGKPDPQASLAARWCAKEAVCKALLSLASRAGSPSAPLADIEILNDSVSQAPLVVLHGAAKTLCEEHALSGFRLTMSHSGDYAMAFAVALSENDSPTDELHSNN